MGQTQQTVSYNINDSVPYDVVAKLLGKLVPSPYAPNAPMNDPTKGIATITIKDMSGNIARDAAGNPLDQITMFQHPTEADFRPVFSVVPGFATAANYEFIVWYGLPYNGVLQWDSEFGTTHIISNNPFETSRPVT
jgi:hypothetical protein